MSENNAFLHLYRGHRLMEQVILRELTSEQELIDEISAILAITVTYNPDLDREKLSPIIGRAALLGIVAGILYMERSGYASSSQSPLSCDHPDPAGA